MSELVSDLLELSRVEAGVASTLTPVGLLVDELAEAIDRSRFAARATEVVIDFDTSGPIGEGSAPVSRHDFGRLVDNLVQNSVTAMQGAGMVSVTVEVASQQLTLTVSDDGPGMADEFILRATDRFSQQDPGTGVGTGLGLAIVATIVRRSGGQLTIANGARGGLHVDVTLPIESIAR
jgi:signal transduction histidine kinase